MIVDAPGKIVNYGVSPHHFLIRDWYLLYNDA
jgi:hypothetical protein